MSVRGDIDLLRKVPLFADIDPVQLQVLVSAEMLVTVTPLVSATGVVQDGGGVVPPPTFTACQAAVTDATSAVV